MIIDLIATFLMISGALLMLIASIGITRMPDIYTRMHTTTKSTSLGILLIFVGMGLVFSGQGVWLKAIIAIVFIFMTVPVASHVIARVAHLMKIQKWEKTVRDDLEDDENQQKTGNKQG
jgi:multicomponent Na+:H+ antiporter subunit G